jgi:hypothetical protein
MRGYCWICLDELARTTHVGEHLLSLLRFLVDHVEFICLVKV